MSNKPVEAKSLGKAAADTEAPKTARDAAALADAVAQATGSIREWLSKQDAGDWADFAPHAARVSEQMVGLQLQLSDLAPTTQASATLAPLRYVIARRAFDSDAQMADELRVHRSQVTRWKQGAEPEPRAGERLIGLDVVVSLLEGFLEPESIPKWLRGINAHLDHRRPLDVLREGRLSEVIRAIEAEKEGAFA